MEQITERCLIAQKKKIVSRSELRVIENIATRDVNLFIANFEFHKLNFRGEYAP